MGFILAINEAIKGKSLKYDALPVSPTITKLCGVINKLDQFINETPPLEQPQRFGNQAFRLWLEKVQNVSFFQTLNFNNLSTYNLCIGNS